jgi:hypothetical protein
MDPSAARLVINSTRTGEQEMNANLRFNQQAAPICRAEMICSSEMDRTII